MSVTIGEGWIIGGGWSIGSGNAAPSTANNISTENLEPLLTENNNNLVTES